MKTSLVAAELFHEGERNGWVEEQVNMAKLLEILRTRLNTLPFACTVSVLSNFHNKHLYLNTFNQLAFITKNKHKMRAKIFNKY